ncbi:MAG: signal transduction histidine kinase [Myxococcota bacterium]|jgi:signal transduction histidine kinase
MSAPAAVARLQRKLTVTYGVVWALSVVFLTAVALLISVWSLEGELDDAVGLLGMAVYGLAWVDEDGFHQELELEPWLLDNAADIRVLQADGTVFYERPTLDLPLPSVLLEEIGEVAEWRFLDGTDGSGKSYRMVAFPLYGPDAVLGMSTVAFARDPFMARWRRLAAGLIAAAMLTLFVGLWLGALLARRSLAPLLEAMEERELLLAAAAHELRNPLASLTAIIESAQAGDESAEQALPRLERVLTVASRRVTRLMTWARLGSSAAVTQEPLRLDLLVEQVLDEDDTVALEAEACIVEGDPAALSVAVRNLLENARLHGRPPIAVAVSDGCVVVTDCGDGFAALDEATRPFSSRPDSPGSGLGLDIVRRVAVAHGGSLGLENRPEGGARIVLRLSTQSD